MRAVFSSVGTSHSVLYLRGFPENPGTVRPLPTYANPTGAHVNIFFGAAQLANFRAVLQRHSGLRKPIRSHMMLHSPGELANFWRDIVSKAIFHKRKICESSPYSGFSTAPQQPYGLPAQGSIWNQNNSVDTRKNHRISKSFLRYSARCLRKRPFRFGLKFPQRS